MKCNENTSRSFTSTFISNLCKVVFIRARALCLLCFFHCTHTHTQHHHHLSVCFYRKEFFEIAVVAASLSLSHTHTNFVYFAFYTFKHNLFYFHFLAWLNHCRFRWSFFSYRTKQFREMRPWITISFATLSQYDIMDSCERQIAVRLQNQKKKIFSFWN